jgi:hypothetical protein
MTFCLGKTMAEAILMTVVGRVLEFSIEASLGNAHAVAARLV